MAQRVLSFQDDANSGILFSTNLFSQKFLKKSGYASDSPVILSPCEYLAKFV